MKTVQTLTFERVLTIHYLWSKKTFSTWSMAIFLKIVETEFQYIANSSGAWKQFWKTDTSYITLSWAKVPEYFLI
jgi:hypothetical protein